MKTHIDKAASRGLTNHGRFKIFHTFSFGYYYNPDRIQFGALRLLDNLEINPGEEIDTHPHKNMEIVSIPLKGELRHDDNMGNSQVIKPGEVQIMSCGTGIYHNVLNNSQTEVLEFLQIWIVPNILNTKPSYNCYDIKSFAVPNKITTFLEPDSDISTLQEVWMSRAYMNEGTNLEYVLKGINTSVYVFVVKGEISIGDAVLSPKDGMEITETDSFELVSNTDDTSVLIIEVSMV